MVQEDLERDVVEHVAEDKQSKEAALRSEKTKVAGDRLRAPSVSTWRQCMSARGFIA